MSALESLAAAVRPWSELYAGSRPLANAVLFVHVGSLTVGGGLAIACDRAMLRTRGAPMDDRMRVLRDVAAAHATVLGAIALMIASGVAMLLADVEELLPSPVLWTKLAFVALLLVNGYVIKQTGARLAAAPAPASPLWRRLARSATASTLLWLVTALVGVIVANL